MDEGPFSLGPAESPTGSRRRGAEGRSWRWSRSRKFFLALALLVVGALAALTARDPILTGLGDLLASGRSNATARVAALTSDAGPAGELEIADLVTQGVVDRVVVLLPRLSGSELDLEQRGVEPHDTVRVLHDLGVPPGVIDAVPAGEGGTTDGTATLAAWCRSHQIHRIMVVTSVDHAHRVGRALGRALHGTTVRIIIHTSPYDDFHPDGWWRHRRTLRAGIIELQKLILDYVQHPLS